MATAHSMSTASPRPAVLTASFLIGPASAMVVVVLVLPLLLLLRYSLNRFVPGQFMVEALTLDNYVKFFADPYYSRVLLVTVAVALSSTLICLLLGYPTAYLLARTKSHYKTLMIMLVVMPLFVGNAVRAAGWIVVFGHQGFLNAALLWLGIVAEPLEIMYTTTAVVVGIVAFNLPFMVLTLQSVIEGIPPSLEEAALGMGAHPLRAFRRVTLPLSLPGIAAGTILCFILAMNAYATPVLLGGPRFQMMAPLVYDQIAQQSNWPLGSALAFILMAATLILTIVSNLVLRRTRRCPQRSASRTHTATASASTVAIAMVIAVPSPDSSTARVKTPIPVAMPPTSEARERLSRVGVAPALAIALIRAPRRCRAHRPRRGSA
jgi:putative spermidine/putrescine transport system permease protein